MPGPESAPETDEIEVTPFALDEESVLALAMAESWLSTEERERADRFRFEVHRERYIRGRGMMRALLARRLGCDPAGLVFAVGERGKPHLVGLPLEFNLSHSEGRAVLAIGSVPSIGIDIECFDRGVDIDGLSRRCFRDSEIAWLAEFGEEEKPRAFFWIWTAKEARMKATGEGFQLEPKRIEIAFSGGRPHRILAPAHPAAHVAAVHLPDGGAACTVAALAPFRVRLVERPVWD